MSEPDAKTDAAPEAETDAAPHAASDTASRVDSGAFPEVPGGYPFPALEREVLERWQRGRIFEKSLEQTAGGREFVFYEGPPTANAKPHVGHVVTRSVKDLFPRFQTLRGRHVVRKGGWDTHGLPVEIEVEKKLGFSGKQEIEDYGIIRFNRACLESVHTYERQWRVMTERLGYWIDLDDPYFTFTNDYVESVWWALARLHEKGLLFQGYKIQPYCARCGTTLSSHEVAQNYQEADDPSIWVLFPARPGQRCKTLDGDTAGEDWEVPEGLRLVAWTTTPWTVLSHVALVVHPDLTYKVVEDPDPERPGGFLLFAEELEKPVPLSAEIDGKRRQLDLRELPAVARLRGRDLVGLRYDRPFRTAPAENVPEATEPLEPPPSDEAGWAVLPGDYVTTAEGTGIVHTSPLFGEDDYRTGQRYGLPQFHTVDAEGKIVAKADIEPFAGRWIKEADPDISRELKSRGLLLHSDRYRHNYPFCWRCNQPLLYYATSSWFVRTTAAKDALVAKNREIHWHPEHVGEGRFGNWLENVVDWALSRRRYWGTPLPVWQCDTEGCDHVEVVGSFEQLFEKAGREPPADPYDREQFDPHRPFVDRDWEEDPFVWPCPACGEGTLGRVEDVIDAWFDSGSMPYAQHHYPFENREHFERKGFPADFISEGVDQTRGWFYTLHVLGVLLFDSPAYKTCIVLGHVNDEQGRKMSKSLGNVVDPLEVIDETGADALRWYFYVNNPEVTARFSTRLVREAAQSFLLPLWNALSFFTIYANLDGWRPGRAPTPEFTSRPPLDRWILLRLGRLVGDVTERLDSYRISEAARGIERFIDELTNWFIRRSRDRFWAAREEEEAAGEPGGAGAAKESAYQALYEVLVTLSKLLAPFTPFLAEVLHRHLVLSQTGDVSADAPESVHLGEWPEPAAGRSEEELERAMGAIQRIVRLGHAARNVHAIKIRQPLSAVTLVTADRKLPDLIAPYTEILEEELNVHAIQWAENRADYVHHEVKPVFPKCGPRFGKQMKEVQQALAASDGDELAAELEERGVITVELSDGPAELSAEEVEVRLEEREGMATQGDRELLVALDTQLTPELIAEGWAREMVHRIQSARKEADLDYADRIRVRYRADPELTAALERHGDWIAEQTLAVELTAAEGLSEEASEEVRATDIDEHELVYEVTRVEAVS